MCSLHCYFLDGLTRVGVSPLTHEYEENKELDDIITKIESFLLRSYSSDYFIKAYKPRNFQGAYQHTINPLRY